MKSSDKAKKRASDLHVRWQKLSDEGTSVKAFPVALEAAKLGDEEAQVWVGYDYAYGMSGAVDVDEALRWWKRAYKQGSWAAAFNLGMWFCDSKQWVKALKWFERAVTAGDADGMVEIAKIHLRYAGDRDAGLHYLKLARAAKAKLTTPTHLELERLLKEQKALTPGNLLHMNADLLDERGKYAEALPLLLKGAKTDDHGCQILLGNYLTNGRKGVPVNREEGIYWYKKAYEGGSSTAACNLGMTYRQEGDMDEAYRWYERAVALGDLESHLEIAKLWLRPRGDAVKAIEHLNAMFSGHVGDTKETVGLSEMDRDEARTLLRRLTSCKGEEQKRKSD
jgi:TPR repeat protein